MKERSLRLPGQRRCETHQESLSSGSIHASSLTLGMLFTAGSALGRYTGAGAMKAGFAMTLLGIVLTTAIIALGG